MVEQAVSMVGQAVRRTDDKREVRGNWGRQILHLFITRSQDLKDLKPIAIFFLKDPFFGPNYI